MILGAEDSIKLKELGEQASDLLVDIIDEELPDSKEPTKLDAKFNQVLTQIYQICPLLSDSYKLMYNHVQMEKKEAGHTYVKQLKLGEK